MTATCSGYNGKVYKAKTQDDFEICFDSMAYHFNNLEIRPLIIWVDKLAMELADSFSAWKVAVETRKCGMAFSVDNELESKILKDVLKNITENDPFIVVNGKSNAMGNKPEIYYSAGQSGVMADFHTNFMNAWGSVLDLLGLENSSNNKKERMIVDESQLNRSIARYISADRLQARKNFCENFNKKFNKNIDVENYLASMVRETENEANEHGDTDKEKKNVL